jgi:hypothetical protein
MKLGKDVFVALAAIAWADGVVQVEEATALVAGARASGLAGGDLEEVRAALRERTDLARIATLSLTRDEREFVYAIAMWLTGVDGVVTGDESAALVKIGDILGLDADARGRGAIASAMLGGFDGASGPRDVTALAKEILGAG